MGKRRGDKRAMEVHISSKYISYMYENVLM
jgi:hypothetical protein